MANGLITRILRKAKPQRFSIVVRWKTADYSHFEKGKARTSRHFLLLSGGQTADYSHIEKGKARTGRHFLLLSDGQSPNHSHFEKSKAHSGCRFLIVSDKKNELTILIQRRPTAAIALYYCPMSRQVDHSHFE